MSSVLTYRPFLLDPLMGELKFDVIESGIEKECFHATEDEQSTRDRVFALIQSSIGSFTVNSIIVEKCKVRPEKRSDVNFYPNVLTALINQAMADHASSTWSNTIVLTDALPIRRKRKAFEKAIKMTLAARLPGVIPYRVYHHDSKSCFGLQVADYFNWAVYRKWDRGDLRSYDLVNAAITGEQDLLAAREERYY